ncbi:DMT family transporter [uncultured Maribacter sp.]|uniref:DMT family transporter n=1 Tax=uncultured Maribacter sp. TaxID=431308 RepID=UPI00262F9C6C|nr:DMT family transporter [uncultured Maribacter sp.]
MDLRRAIYFMMLSTIAFACMNVLIKYLTAYDTFELVFFRSLGTLFFTFGILIHKKIPILGTHKKLLVLRGVVGVTSMSLFFLAIHYMPVGSAVGLRYISPIFAAIFAIFMLKEKIKPVQWLFFLMSFVGVIALKGFDKNVSILGFVFAIAAAATSGLVYTIIRKIGDREHPVVIVNYFMCIATVVGGVLASFNWKTPHGIDILLLFSLGVLGYVGQIFMTKAFQIGETNIIAPIKYIEVVFSIVAGIGFLNEEYTILSIVGMLLIITGVLLNIWYKRKYSAISV